MRKFQIKFLILVMMIMSTSFISIGCSAPHEHAYTSSTIAPTCVEQGYTLHKCLCNDEYRDNYVEALGHLFENYVSNNDATYDADGTKTAICEREDCGATDTIADTGTMLERELLFELAPNGESYYVKGIGTYNKEHLEIPAIYKDKPVTRIADKAFRECSTIKTVTIPDTVTDIGFSSFSLCYYITSVTLGSGVQRIGNYAFQDCYKLVEVINNSPNLTIGKNSSYGMLGKHAYSIFNSGDTYECEFDTDSDGFVTYTNETDTILVDYIGTDKNVVIPNGVTKINPCAIRNNDNLTSISIPDTVVDIGLEAFNSCNSLNTLIIGKNVKQFGEDVFAGENAKLNNFEKVYFNGSVDEWCQIDFYWYYSNPLWYAKEFYIDNTLVESATITVEEINSYAFCGYDLLSHLTLSANLKNIKSWALFGCNLNRIDYLGTIDEWAQINNGGEVFKTDTGLYIDNELVTSANITTATRIAVSAFAGYTKLTSLTIGDSVETIGQSAFNSCTNLTSVTIGQNVSSIEGYAFYKVKFPETFVLGDSVKSIGEYAFGSAGIVDLTLPKDLESINKKAFDQCLIERATVPAIAICVLPQATLKVIEINGGDTIPEDALKYYDVTTITLSNSIKTIESGAFKCVYHSNAEFAESKIEKVYYLGTIDEWVEIEFEDIYSNPLFNGKTEFYVNNQLVTSVNITTATKISATAFKNYQFITSVSIGSSVQSIENVAFEECYSLRELIINEGVTNIGVYAFRSCNSLTSIVIPDSVTSIEYWAFAGCTSLTSIVIPDSVTSIGEGILVACPVEQATIPAILIPEIRGEHIKEVIITSGESIGDYAFGDCLSLTSVFIPDTVTSISNYAFRGCSSLTTIEVSQGNETYKSIDGNLYSKDGTTLIQYATGKTETTLILPDSVTSIGDYACYDCKSLTSIVIPDTVTSIGDYAFRNCSWLKSVIIPDSVTDMGAYVFPTSNIRIYCEAERKPNGWNYNWWDGHISVTWGYVQEA